MELVAFSVTNYRSITKANKLPIRRLTVLLGQNNEGKSNILRALVTSLDVLSRIGRTPIQRGRFRVSDRVSSNFYEWQRDFPISLQAKQPDGESVFNIELRLSEPEVSAFEVEVKSKLNGTLPIQLTLGQQQPGFKVMKKGPGGPALSKKSELIARFVSKRINLSYMPAVRTASSSHSFVDELVQRELAVIENEPQYKQAMAELAKLQKPILERISSSLKGTLVEFLPNVKSVAVSIPAEERVRALRRSCEIVVDDGTPTALTLKGDGVQSLAALSLMRHPSTAAGSTQNLILAIEEPESHLHPSAIHQLRKVLADIAKKHQVIMTTHCPLFVDRTNIKSNIIVHESKATPASDVQRIRAVLGIRASDNLQNAELTLVVEGEDDRKSMDALLRHHSKTLGLARANHALGIESLQGGTNLSYKLSQIRECLCPAHSFLDNDDCGRSAVERAKQDGLLEIADVTLASCVGMDDSEFEDMLEETLYGPLLQNRYGVPTQSPKFKIKGKWSSRAEAAFKHQGKLWNDKIKANVKADIADLVIANPGTALNAHKRSAFDALVSELESKLKAMQNGKA